MFVFGWGKADTSLTLKHSNHLDIFSCVLARILMQHSLVGKNVLAQGRFASQLKLNLDLMLCFVQLV